MKKLVSRRRLSEVSLFTRLSSLSWTVMLDCHVPSALLSADISNSGRKRENARLLSWYKHGSFFMRRKLWKMVVLPVFFTSCGTFVRPEGYIDSWKSVLFGADWWPSVLSWNVLFNVFKKIVIWRKVWGVGTNGSIKDTHNSKLGSQGKWRYFDQIRRQVPA